MNVLEYGTRRQGKSTLALAIAVTQNPRVVVFDPNNQFPLVQAVPIEYLPEWLTETEESPGFAVVRVGPFDTEFIPKAFLQFSEALYEVPNLSVIVDEAHVLQGNQWLDPNLDRWNRRSPASVTVVQTTHRIVDAHPDSRYHADHVFLFFTDSELELKAIGRHFGDEVKELVPRLKLHQVLHWWRETGGYRKYTVWDKPDEWFIDLENKNEVVT